MKHEIKIKKKPFHLIEKLVTQTKVRPLLITLLSLTILIISMLFIPKLKLELDLYGSRDNNFPTLDRLQEMSDDFQDSNSMHLLLTWPNEPQGAQLCHALEKLKIAEGQVTATKSVQNIFKLRQVHSEPRQYWYPLTLKDPCEHPNEFYHVIISGLEPQHPYAHMVPSSKQLLVQVLFNPDFDVSAVGKWLDLAQDPSYKVAAAGPVMYRYHMKEILKTDSKYHLLILIFFILFFRFVLGTWRAGLYYLVTLGLSFTFLSAIMAMLNYPIDTLSSNLFLITAIAGTSDYFFVVWGMIKGKTLFESLIHYSRAAFFTSITTIIGFLSLLTSDLEIVQRFGVSAAIGAAVEWIVTFLIFPAFIFLFKFKDNFVTSRMDSKIISSVRRMNSWSPPSVLLIFGIVITMAAPFLFSKLKFEEIPLKNFPVSHQLRKDYDQFKAATGWQGVLHLVVPKATKSSVISKCLADIKSENVIRTDNPFDIENYFLKGLPSLRQDAVSRDLRHSGMLKSYHSDYSTRSALYLKSTNPSDLDALNLSITKHCPPQSYLVGQSEVYREVSDVLSRTLFDSFITSLFLVLLIIFFIQWRTQNKNYLAVAVSALFGPLFMISMMALFSVPISPINSMFLAILVGMTGDNAIQYLFSAENNDLSFGVKENGSASILIGILMCGGSLFFLFQTLMPMKILGILFATGFAINLSGDLWFLNGLLKLKNQLVNKNVDCAKH